MGTVTSTFTPPKSKIVVFRYKYSYQFHVDGTNIKNIKEIDFENYSIKETDMRIKTFSFTTTEKFDLTQGRLGVFIMSEAHENVGGVILSISYDEEKDLYSYSCQDYNRLYLDKLYFVSNGDYEAYELIKSLILREDIPIDEISEQEKAELLVGLKPKEEYMQLFNSGIGAFNPMTDKSQLIFDKISRGDIIRNLLLQKGACIDIYFDMYGHIMIEPYDHSKWLGEGLYLTTPELASYDLKFDITNIITDVKVKAEDKFGEGKWFLSKKELGVDLAIYFGDMTTTIDNPNRTQQENSVGSGVGVSTDTPIVVATDNIHNHNKDSQMLQDMKSTLESKGYSVTIGGIGPNSHVSKLKSAPNGSCLYTVVGGLCAGTFKDMGSNYYQQMINDGNKRVVLGVLSPPVKDNLDTLDWLPRAWDDNFSGGSFKGLENPGQFLKDNGIQYIYGSSGTELAEKFAGGGSSSNNNVTANTVMPDVNEIPNVEGESTTVDINSAEYVEKEKREAIKQMTEQVRDLLTFKLEVPGGSPLFKNLHTNSFIWTELPKDILPLANYDLITSRMTGEYSRFTGYVLNRWYVESVNIKYDSKGLFFTIELNPFASPFSSYSSALEQAINAYAQATQQDVESEEISTYTGNISSDIKTAAKQICTGISDSSGKSQAIFNWVKSNVSYDSYSNTRHGADGTMKRKAGNCCDQTHLFIGLARAVGLNCRYAHGPNHVWANVQLNGRWQDVDPTQRSYGKIWKGMSAYEYFDELPF